ncbi:MAG: hypothetical protein JWQ09_2334 [Segetibacter sp.]|nr:hypothetical protein [Segetibacter sp.]
MGKPFRDITLYTTTPHTIGDPKYYEETALQNYISDLYITCMHGYKPPNTTRVSLQAGPEKMWDRTWKDGSLITVANYFHYDKYASLDLHGKYKYILDIIQDTMVQLSLEYNWDKSVFERAHREVIERNFLFNLNYPVKTSKDKKKKANLSIEKTETITTVNACFTVNEQHSTYKLFDKKNWWWYDSAYKIVENSKWFDNDRFGIHIKQLNFSVWYSLTEQKVLYEVNGVLQENYNLKRMFPQY